MESPGGLAIVDGETGADVWKHQHKGIVRAVLERSGAEPPTLFSVQVASVSSQEAAEQMRERLQTETGELVEVTRNPDRTAWRVRVGQRTTREEIEKVEEVLRELGFSETWIVQEEGAGGKRPRIRLVDEDYNDLLADPERMLVLPVADGRHLVVDEKAYRGTVELRVTRGGRLKAINIVNLEEYLRGVVPLELGPEVFPELEAQKAQAVAARTYIVANRGQFSEDGYDICDTARCQVYGGSSAEHELSDRAVQETAGVVAAYEDRPINAMYTSTCGGHTEDLQTVFREMEGPYLKGVRCYPEDEVLSSMRVTLHGAWSGTTAGLASGEPIDGALARLEVLGVLSPEEISPATLAGAPEARQVGEWTGRTLRVIGKSAPDRFDLSRKIGGQADLADYLIGAFGWTERLTFLSEHDLPALLNGTVIDATPEASRSSLAYLVKEEILPRPVPGETAADDAVTRAVLARALHSMILRYDAMGLKPARFRGLSPEGMGLEVDDEIVFHPLAERIHLGLDTGRAAVPLAEHTLLYGDKLQFHLSGEGKIDYLFLERNRQGASDDRFSKLYTWEERVSRDELSRRIRERASIGELLDVVPGKRGVSGRIRDLTVLGTRGRFTFRGFSIESLLGLRETLFLVDRQYGPDGKVETFIFSGKGWGHGVGMCQVGAFGMALRGKTYEEILGHYYTGITLTTLERIDLALEHPLASTPGSE